MQQSKKNKEWKAKASYATKTGPYTIDGRVNAIMGGYTVQESRESRGMPPGKTASPK